MGYYLYSQWEETQSWLKSNHIVASPQITSP